MPTEKTTDKPATKQTEFTPRRVTLIIGGARGKRFVDTDTREDLRLPTMSVTSEFAGSKPNAHLTVDLTAIEYE